MTIKDSHIEILPLDGNQSIVMLAL